MTATGSQNVLRWLVDPPADGVTNMARDEAVLTCVSRGTSPTTLRFYRWDPPTISLGYFQQFADFAALPLPAGRLPVVRRTTGGGAILHDRELTYSLTLPVGHPLLRVHPTTLESHRRDADSTRDSGRTASSVGPNALYNHVHEAVAALLARHGIVVTKEPAGRGGCSHGGPFFCFERHCCFDLMAGGRKIMGSAQRRTPQAILQHGSLILARRFDQQRCAAVSDLGALDVNDHLRELAEAIAGQALGEPSQYTPEELALAEQLRAKYADAAWTKRR